MEVDLYPSSGVKNQPSQLKRKRLVKLSNRIANKTYRFNLKESFMKFFVGSESMSVLSNEGRISVEKMRSRQDNRSTLFTSRDVKDAISSAKFIFKVRFTCTETSIVRLVGRSLEELIRDCELQTKRPLVFFE